MLKARAAARIETASPSTKAAAVQPSRQKAAAKKTAVQQSAPRHAVSIS